MLKKLLFILICSCAIGFTVTSKQNEVLPIVLPKIKQDTSFTKQSSIVKIQLDYAYLVDTSHFVFITEKVWDTITGLTRVRKFYSDTSLFSEVSEQGFNNPVNKHIILTKKRDTLLFIDYRKNSLASHFNPYVIKKFNNLVEKNRNSLTEKFGRLASKNIHLNFSKTIANSFLFNNNEYGLPKQHPEYFDFFYDLSLKNGYKIPLFNKICLFDSSKTINLGKPQKIKKIKLTIDEVLSISKKNNFTDSIAPLIFEVLHSDKSNHFSLKIKSIISKNKIQENNFQTITLIGNINLTSGRFKTIDTLLQSQHIGHIKTAY